MGWRRCRRCDLMMTSEIQSGFLGFLRRRFGLPSVLLIVFGLVGGVCAQDADGEKKPPKEGEAAEEAKPEQPKFAELPVDEGAKQQQREAEGCRKAGKFEPGKKQVFDTYYQTFALPRWTQPATLSKLPDFRKELRVNLAQAKSGEVHDYLNSMALEFMKKLLDAKYHPAVRVNAVLMIGDLNATEQTTSADAKPLPEALKSLREIAEDPKQEEALRVAAMVGIQRHVAAGVEPEVKKSLTDAMLKQLAVEIPEGPAGVGLNWLHGQAIDVLGRLGSLGENNAVYAAVLDSLSNRKRRLSFSTRCMAAESLGRLNFNGAKVDVNDVLTRLGQFIVKTCEEELRLAKDGDKSFSRRRLPQCLRAVRIAVEGEDAGAKDRCLKALAGDAKKEHVANLSMIMEAKMELFIDRRDRLDGERLTVTVEELRDAVNDWLKE